MFQDCPLALGGSSTVAAHGGKNERLRALTFEPVAECAGEDIDAGNAPAADSYSNAFPAQSAGRQCQSIKGIGYFLR